MTVRSYSVAVMQIRLATLAGATLLATASPAAARGFRQDQLPQAPNGCNTCHTNGSGTPRNSFGQDVESTLNGTAVDWPAICMLDSDNDGATNGQELDDPNCTWRIGDSPRTGTSYDPANPNVFPPAMDAGMPDTGAGMPDTGVGMPDTGVDAGMMDSGAMNDSGVDAGVDDAGTNPDSGNPMEDAGPTPDAGTPTPDAGTATDAGSGTDTGVVGDTDDEDEGCRCAEPSSAQGRFGALALLAIGLILRRRRR